MNLASHITHWPEAATHAVVDGGVIAFTKGGAPVWSNEEWTILGGADASVRWVQISGAKMSKEWCAEKHIVTRAQWEAERARIASDKPNSEPESGQRAQYEQELWDRAYEGAWHHEMKSCDPNNVTQEMFSHMTECAAAIADAFMAERAKRMKK